MDPRLRAVVDGVALRDGVRDGGIAEVDADAHVLVMRRIGGSPIGKGADGVTDDVVLDDHSVRMVDGDAATVVHGGQGMPHHVLLDQRGAVRDDADISDGVHAIIPDGHPVARGADSEIAPCALPRAVHHGDLVERIVGDRRIVPERHGRSGIGVPEDVPAIVAICSRTADAVVEVPERAAGHRHMVRPVIQHPRKALMPELQILHTEVGAMPIAVHAVLVHGGLHGLAVRVAVVQRPEIKLLCRTVVVPLPGAVQFGKFPPHVEAPWVAAHVERGVGEVERTVRIAGHAHGVEGTAGAANDRQGPVPIPVGLREARALDLASPALAVAQPAGVRIAGRGHPLPGEVYLLHPAGGYRGTPDVALVHGPLGDQFTALDERFGPASIGAQGDLLADGPGIPQYDLAAPYAAAFKEHPITRVEREGALVHPPDRLPSRTL